MSPKGPLTAQAAASLAAQAEVQKAASEAQAIQPALELVERYIRDASSEGLYGVDVTCAQLKLTPPQLLALCRKLRAQGFTVLTEHNGTPDQILAIGWKPHPLVRLGSSSPRENPFAPYRPGARLLEHSPQIPGPIQFCSTRGDAPE